MTCNCCSIDLPVASARVKELSLRAHMWVRWFKDRTQHTQDHACCFTHRGNVPFAGPIHPPTARHRNTRVCMRTCLLPPHTFLWVPGPGPGTTQAFQPIRNWTCNFQPGFDQQALQRPVVCCPFTSARCSSLLVADSYVSAAAAAVQRLHFSLLAALPSLGSLAISSAPDAVARCSFVYLLKLHVCWLQGAAWPQNILPCSLCWFLIDIPSIGGPAYS